MFSRVSTGIIAIMALVIVVLLVKLQTPKPSLEFSKSFQNTVTFHKRIDANLPPNPILFIGDSHIQGLAVSAVTLQGVNFGIGNDTTLGVLHRLPQYTSVSKARAIVLAIGFNDLKRRDNEAIVKNISQILAEIPSDMPLLLCGIMPVDEEAKKLKGYNERIIKLNNQLSLIACSRSNTNFLDPLPVLGNATGSLPASLHCGDGIHLNSEGYYRWISAMKDGLLIILP